MFYVERTSAGDGDLMTLRLLITVPNSMPVYLMSLGDSIIDFLSTPRFTSPLYDI